MFDLYGVVLDILNDLRIDSSSSIHHDLQLESRWVSNLGCQIFEQSEDKT